MIVTLDAKRRLTVPTSLARMRDRITDLLVRHTGKSRERIHEDTDRDYILTADQAKEYGIIDEVIQKKV